MRERVCTYKTDVWAFGILCWEVGIWDTQILEIFIPFTDLR